MEPLIEQGAQPRLPAVSRRLLAVAKSFTTPHLPDDYLALLDPRWSLDEAVATVERRVVEAPGVVTLVLRPSFPVAGAPAGAVRAGRSGGARHPPLAGLHRHLRSGAPAGAREHHGAARRRGPDVGLPHRPQRCPPGTRLWLGQVEGAFVLPEVTEAPLLMISAGCGITPIWAMLRELERRGGLRDVVHLHGARDAGRFVFGAPLRDLEQRHAATSSTSSTPPPTGACTASSSTRSSPTGGSDARSSPARRDARRLRPALARVRRSRAAAPGAVPPDDRHRRWSRHGRHGAIRREPRRRRRRTGRLDPRRRRAGGGSPAERLPDGDLPLLHRSPQGRAGAGPAHRARARGTGAAGAHLRERACGDVEIEL